MQTSRGAGSTTTLLAIVLAAGCRSQPPFRDPFTRPQIDWRPSLVLDVGEAGRILGNHSRLEKVTAYAENGTTVYQSAFRDDWLDPDTGKTGILYYMYEDYPSADAARSFLVSTLKANHIEPGDGIRVRGGAELHYLRGGEVIRMVMILKENHLIRLKVNQLTSRYSLAEFKNVAEALANRL
ncbi:MAG: hypothetical protein ACJ79R_21540 [Anaeromyxobacteraceae bacterium]